MKQFGSGAIAAGGFGCVFKPSLKCDDNTRHDGISKLLLKKNAKTEENEILKIKKIVKTLPLTSHIYFIGMNAKLCNPAPLSSIDKIEFDSKCTNLTKKNIYESNINSRLHELSIIQLEDGGIDIDSYYKNQPMTLERFDNVNQALLNLLKFAIVEINHKKLYHFDIKDSNVVIAPDNIARLIDWGLAGISTDKHIIPESIIGRPFQYNLPLTNILLIKSFPKWLSKQIKHNNQHVSLEWVDYANSNGYDGHFSYINEIISTIYDTNDPIKIKNIYQTYLSTAIHKYTINNKFDQIKYFEEVFSKNVDILGFILIYFKIIKLYNKEKSHFIGDWVDIVDRLKIIMRKYVYNATFSIQPIPVNALFYELQNVSRRKYKNKTIKNKSNIYDL